MGFWANIFKFRSQRSAETEIIIGELQRNDVCYCGSKLKYKKCHAPILAKKRKTAYIVENTNTKTRSVKVMKTRRVTTNRIKSNLRWEDIGRGGPGKIDP